MGIAYFKDGHKERIIWANDKVTAQGFPYIIEFVTESGLYRYEETLEKLPNRLEIKKYHFVKILNTMDNMVESCSIERIEL